MYFLQNIRKRESKPGNRLISFWSENVSSYFSESKKIDKSVTLQTIKNNYFKYVQTKDDKHIVRFVQSPEKVLNYLSAVYVDENVIPRLKHGSPVFAPGIIAFTSDIKKGNNVGIYDTSSNLLALGIAEMSAKEIKNVEKGLSINTDVVFIK